MKCDVCCDNDCLDLPSLTDIYCIRNGCEGINRCIGHVILEGTTIGIAI